MRVLALYDIHGNVDALDAVLADPRAQDPDLLVVGGDVAPGPFVVQALDRLRELGVPARMIRGNGEREVGQAAGAPAPPSAPDDLAALTAAVTAVAIGPEAARKLAALPLTVTVDDVLYCHASPRRDDEILTRRSSPERYAAALAGTAAPVVIAGHTHQQDDRAVGDIRFLNAGSVGLPYEGDGAARWAWVEDGRPELRRTAYDAAAAGRRMLAAGWPDEDSIGAALLEPIDPETVTAIFEDRAAGA